MSSVSQMNNHKGSKPSPSICSTSGVSYGGGVDVLPPLVTSAGGRARKPRKTATGRLGSTKTFTSSSSMGSSSSTSDSHRPPNSIADLVLQPQHYTALLLQAPINCDSNERHSIPTSTDALHSKETSKLVVPPSTSISDDSIRIPAIIVSEVDSEFNVLIKGITYDGILASTLHKGITEILDIPTRPPPNSPAAIQEGEFSSLLGVSMAIMQS